MKHHMYVVDKSTVPVGTAQIVRETIQRELDKRGSDLTFHVISNPEFLKEGTAVADCMKPDRVVIGAGSSGEDGRAVQCLFEKHRQFYFDGYCQRGDDKVYSQCDVGYQNQLYE